MQEYKTDLQQAISFATKANDSDVWEILNQRIINTITETK